jgi:hypothetical protein
MTSVVRFKCPGCENTYKDTAGLQHSRRSSNSNISTGIINHLKNAGHANVPDVITREDTLVEGIMVGGKFMRNETQAQIAQTSASNPNIVNSLEEVRLVISIQYITPDSVAQLMVFTDFADERNAGISDDADAKFLVKAKTLLEMQIESAFKERYFICNRLLLLWL